MSGPHRSPSHPSPYLDRLRSMVTPRRPRPPASGHWRSGAARRSGRDTPPLPLSLSLSLGPLLPCGCLPPSGPLPLLPAMPVKRALPRHTVALFHPRSNPGHPSIPTPSPSCRDSSAEPCAPPRPWDFEPPPPLLHGESSPHTPFPSDRTTFPNIESHCPEASLPPPRRATARVSSAPDRLARRPPYGLRKLKPVVVLHRIIEATAGSHAMTTAGAR
jgi:hypothetical protein